MKKEAMDTLSKTTENGIATDNDDERIEFVTTVLKDVHKFQKDNKNLIFQLENKRNLDRKTLNLIRNKEISATIS